MKKKHDFLNKLFNSYYSVFLLILIIFLINFRSIQYDYVYYDDSDLLIKNSLYFKNLNSITKLFTEDVFLENQSNFYRPVMNLIFFIEYQISSSVHFFHLMNIIYHILAIILIFRLLIEMNYSFKESFLLCLFFVLHPILLQAVQWIPGRNDILLTIFIILGFFYNYKLYDSINKISIKNLLLFALFFNLALYTKETAILFIFISIYFALFIKKLNFRNKNFIIAILIELFSILIYFYLRNIFLNKSTNEISYVKFDFETISGFLTYLQKIIFPFNLTPIPTVENINYYLILISLIFIVFISFFIKIENKNLFTFGLLWFIIFLVPTFIQTQGFSVFFEHRAYLSFAGLLLTFGSAGLKSLLNKYKLYLFSLIIILFVIKSYTYSNTFSDKYNFWEEVIKTNNKFSYAYNNLANIYLRDGNNRKAEELYQIGLNYNNYDANLNNNYGYLLKQKNEYDSALIYFTRAIKLNKNLPEAYNNRGNLYLNKKQFTEAEKDFLKAIEINPDYFEAINGLAVVYINMMDYEKAEYYFKKSVDINPDFAEGYFNLALLYLAKNQKERAIIEYKKAIALGLKVSEKNRKLFE